MDASGVDFSVLFELEHTPHVLPEGEIVDSDKKVPITNAIVEYGEDDEGAETRQTTPLDMGEIISRVFNYTDGWPKRVGQSLFVHDGEAVCWLNSPASLFGWLGRKHGAIQWYRSVGCATKEELFHELQRTAEQLIAVEALPHEPPIAGHYYACEDLPEPTGEHISNLIARFSPATAADRWLLLAMFATAFWGGRGGSRPMFVITSDSGRGAGKTKLSDVLSHLVGGCIELSANEDSGVMRQRLLSPGGKNKRIARLDNVKSLRFSWADLESLVTVPTISGKEMYVGEGSRPNNLTWIITLNGPSLSTDIAQRAVIVKLDRPIRNPRWEEETLSYIDHNRPQIIADIIACLKLPQQPIDYQTRWAAWEHGVLSRLRCDVEGVSIADIQDVLKQRSGESDAEGEEAELIEEAFESRLINLGYVTQIDKIHIPTHIAVEWFNEATNERRTVQAASRMLTQLITEGRLKSIKKNPSRANGRGLLWCQSQIEQNARYDIEQRIRNFKKEEIQNRERARLETQEEIRQEREDRNRYW